MKGIFQDGPTIDPLFHIYLTAENHQRIQYPMYLARSLTLIVCDEYQE